MEFQRRVYLFILFYSVCPSSCTFSAIWNVPSFMCRNKFGITFNLSRYGIISNNNGAFRGDSVTIFYRNQLGLYPWIDRTGNYHNGGLPQLADLRSHLGKVSNDLDTVIPDVGFSGVAVIDWEEWRPIFTRNHFNKRQEIYIDQSTDLVRRQHPDWSDEKIRDVAEKEFEAAARTLMQQTLQLCRQLRPHGRWGFYGFPSCYNYLPGERGCAQGIIEENNRLGWMFYSSSALFPSIYQEVRFGTHEDRYWRVHGELEETLRVRELFGVPDTPIFPYTRYRYGDTRQFYDMGDLNNTIQQCYVTKLDGVVLWDSSSDLRARNQCEDFSTFLTDKLGPYVKTYATPPLQGGPMKDKSRLERDRDTASSFDWLQGLFSLRSQIYNFMAWVVLT